MRVHSCNLVLPQEEFQLTVEEAQQGSAGRDLSVAVVDHESLVAQILAIDALGACWERHHLGMSQVQTCLTRSNSLRLLHLQIFHNHNQQGEHLPQEPEGGVSVWHTRTFLLCAWDVLLR